MSEPRDHPDLDTLSASLDAQGDVSAHVAECAACRSVVAGLQAARSTVAQPVPPPPDAVRERAIAAALGAADAWTRAAPVAGPVVPVVPVVPARAPAPVPVVPLPPSRSRWWVPVSGVAAALLLVVGAVALLNRGGGNPARTALSAGPSATESATESAAESASDSARAKSAATGDLSNLGDVADVNALRARLRAVTPSPLSAVAPAAGAANTPAAGAGASANALTSPSPVQVGTRVCEEQARTARPTLGVVVYAANLTYAGTPAVALGFATRASDPPATVLVLAPGQGCRVLAETSLP